LQAYVDWQNTNSPGSVAPIEDFGIVGAVASDTFALDSDMNFDRLLIKARVPASMASTSDSLIIGIEIDGSLSKTKTFGLMEDPLDNSFLLTDKPFLLYDDPNGELDTGAVVSYLPESTELLDPPVVATAVTAFIGSTANPPAARANVANYQLNAVSALFSHTPASNPTTYTPVAGVIPSPAANANWRLLYTPGFDDATPDIRISAQDPTARLGNPTAVTWWVSVTFKAGDGSHPANRLFNVTRQWHQMGTVVPLTFDSTGGGILTALQADQWTDALGPADYEIYARAQFGAGQSLRVYESNLVRFKIVGENPGKNAITTFVDEFLFIEPGGTVTQTIADRLLLSMRAWFKSILKHESRKGAYTGRLDWDHFENNPETAGIDIGFQRSLTNPPRTWLARYGWPFVSYDNGYGVAQLTNPPPAYRHVSRWKNNVYKAWLIFSQDKLRNAITYLQGLKGAALVPADDPVLLREAVKEYNGGHQYTAYANGAFVLGPSSPNPNYVNDVETDGTAEGWLP
jgi:hypothetical protein